MMFYFNHSYASLPSRFFEQVQPESFKNPSLIAFNQDLADFLQISIQDQSKQALAEIFSGQKLVDDAHPIAMAYAGHQFGHFVKQLGDGRAHLLGEVQGINAQAYDIVLKGAGRTPFSRNGDGRSYIGPVLREYLVSEAMHHLGIPTTRSLAFVTTGEKVQREQLYPGAILTRVAQSHLRIGTFEYFSHQEDIEGLQTLTDYAIHRHAPKLAGQKNAVEDFFYEVGKRQVQLIAKWMGVGFIHGVMNTDNTSISGETLDYGPCAFIDHFDFKKVYSSIDQQGRYSYANQPQIIFWNLSSLAHCLSKITKPSKNKDEVPFQDIFQTLEHDFKNAFLHTFSQKIGMEHPQEKDAQLIDGFLSILQNHHLDFTQSFRNLAAFLNEDMLQEHALIDPFKDWLKPWKARVTKQDRSIQDTQQSMNQINPIYIPRNHLVEQAIKQANDFDFTLFEKLHKRYQNPFDESPGDKVFALPPTPEQEVKETFCGT